MPVFGPAMTRRGATSPSSVRPKISRPVTPPGQPRVGRDHQQVAHGIDRDADDLQQLRLRPLDRAQRLGVAVGVALEHEHAAIAGVADEDLVVLLVDGDGLGPRQVRSARPGSCAPALPRRSAPPRKITTAAASGFGAMISSLRRVVRDAVRRPAQMRQLPLDDPSSVRRFRLPAWQMPQCAAG